MKEATGELNMTVVAIIVIAALLGIVTWAIKGDIGATMVCQMKNAVLGASADCSNAAPIKPTP